MTRESMNRIAVNEMLYKTCGEDLELLMYANVEEVSPNKFHITYREDDPYEGIDLMLEIDQVYVDNYKDPSVSVHYIVTESKYEENGDFTLEFNI